MKFVHTCVSGVLGVVSFVGSASALCQNGAIRAQRAAERRIESQCKARYTQLLSMPAGADSERYSVQFSCRNRDMSAVWKRHRQVILRRLPAPHAGCVVESVTSLGPVVACTSPQFEQEFQAFGPPEGSSTVAQIAFSRTSIYPATAEVTPAGAMFTFQQNGATYRFTFVPGYGGTELFRRESDGQFREFQRLSCRDPNWRPVERPWSTPSDKSR